MSMTLTDDQIRHSHDVADLTAQIHDLRRALSDVRWSVGIANDAHLAGDAPAVVSEYLDRTLARIDRITPTIR